MSCLFKYVEFEIKGIDRQSELNSHFFFSGLHVGRKSSVDHGNFRTKVMISLIDCLALMESRTID